MTAFRTIEHDNDAEPGELSTGLNLAIHDVNIATLVALVDSAQRVSDERRWPSVAASSLLDDV